MPGCSSFLWEVSRQLPATSRQQSGLAVALAGGWKLLGTLHQFQAYGKVNQKVSNFRGDGSYEGECLLVTWVVPKWKKWAVG